MNGTLRVPLQLKEPNKRPGAQYDHPDFPASIPPAQSPSLIDFSSLGHPRVQAIFDEPELSSDGGALVLREAAEANGIIDAMTSVIRDDRDTYRKFLSGDGKKTARSGGGGKGFGADFVGMGLDSVL